MKIKPTSKNQSGLSNSEVKTIRKTYGSNIIQASNISKFKKIISWVLSPISLMLLSASGLSYAIGKVFDFYFILILYLINFSVGQWQEYKADNAIAQLQSTFSFKTLTKRDGVWKKIESTQLVPGDIVSLHGGDVIPADILILEAKEPTIDESSITGESESVIKNNGDTGFSGTTLISGELTAQVTNTGNKTHFGKTLLLAQTVKRQSSLEQDILRLSKFLAGISIICIIILSIGLFLSHTALSLIITTDLSLLIAGVPVAMPTVISLIMSLGLTTLAKKKVVVRRLASLEDLANVNLLLSDKTGTLTHHHIAVSKVIPFNSFSESDVLQVAALSTKEEDSNTISLAIRQSAGVIFTDLPSPVSLIPGDSVRKRTTANGQINNVSMLVSVGAPQVILELSQVTPELSAEIQKEINSAAEEGFRSIAVAFNKTDFKEHNMIFAGLILLADTVREDAQPTVSYLNQQGIAVKMVTGDHMAIAKHVATTIGLTGVIYDHQHSLDSAENKTLFDGSAGFAEVFPEDKLSLVNTAKQWYKVAVTGDGVNDIPAVSAADVGIAVKNAVDALRSTADIVLLTDGIAIIKNAIIEARKIFTRVFFYSVYRLSESFRVILSITILGLLYHAYPLSPVHLLLLALLNDIPIISLAYDRVKALNRPSAINVKQRMTLSLLFGGVGLLNSLLFFVLLRNWQFSSDIIQTAFFLKLTVSGHLLIYVSHTEDRWWKFLPHNKVITATAITQIIATIMALTGFVIAKIPWQMAVFVWLWSIFWMQAAELVKWLRQRYSKTKLF